ncbi:CCA tRNA nucleotidyltransferase [Jannaschia seohaensis]|uniref:Poly(A) polymerase n=1 Tax=Jannaschia seohaensis TaxID=475081 RepID=A0A2Y9AWW1_9RHOB|nr:CCA tRNA nucleotidyltransferase [Jannaschia seohaensis]PWJ16524.1 poly(A) polymerase [Jannaschia seohaensis]SSA48761.1 poly(A) polymerase [Jannaschia seohaensis]
MISDDWLTAAPTQAVMAMLEAGGHQALAVGGCVRNGLLGAPVADIDIATDARPERVMELARAAGLKPVPTGIDHGTVTVVAGGEPHEVTTFRRDEETDGRRATVAFTEALEEDAARRDFTMNALYVQRDGTVVDPLGGLPDLEARRVRFIRDPDARIREDYLRILRFFRFTAWYGDPELGIDAEGLAACAEHAEGLARLSAERVGHEMRKLLAAPDPAPAVAAMAQAGILARVMPGADPAALAPAILLGLSDWIDRAAALGGETEGWRLSRAEARELAALSAAARGSDRPFALGDRLGPRGMDAVRLRAALLGAAPDPDDITLAERGAAASFPLRAADLMPALQGPALGQALDRARDLWREADGALTKDELVAATLDA